MHILYFKFSNAPDLFKDFLFSSDALFFFYFSILFPILYCENSKLMVSLAFLSSLLYINKSELIK